MTSGLIEAALKLQERTGWHLFPIVGKVPATGKGGLHRATNIAEGLRGLFHEAPGADGFAVNCGASDLVALDPDTKNGLDGRDSLREAGCPWLEEETVRAITPSGAEHCFFSGRTASRTGILPNVDVKSGGGYVGLPPSPGRTWQAGCSPWEVPLAPVPAWLIKLVGTDKHRPATDPTEWERALTEGVREGGRNNMAARLAGHLLRRDVNARVVLQILLAVNRARFRPPLEDEDIETVVASICKAEAERREGRRL
jgi:hypothetical protein